MIEDLIEEYKELDEDMEDEDDDNYADSPR